MTAGYIFGQLFLNVIGGLITAGIVWCIGKPIVKKYITVDMLTAIKKKEVQFTIIAVGTFIIYVVLVWSKLIPPPEFHDYAEVEKDGYRCTVDLCHPDKPPFRTEWRDRNLSVEPDKNGNIHIEYK